jgi:hypothetical protein
MVRQTPVVREIETGDPDLRIFLCEKVVFPLLFPNQGDLQRIAIDAGCTRTFEDANGNISSSKSSCGTFSDHLQVQLTSNQALWFVSSVPGS